MDRILIECVPNFSEGRDEKVIHAIADVIKRNQGVALIGVEPGKATNRTVMTFVGSPEQVISAAFDAIKTAAQLIDMSKHKGEHPRMGATDVCPLIPISGITLEETAEYARKLAKRVGEELSIPTYLYEAAASKPERSNLSEIRSGEYEGFFEKIKKPEWTPDFGPNRMNESAGATVIGARDFLVAYNVNLNTASVKKANSIAFDVRENGRVVKSKGVDVLDEKGQVKRTPGVLKHVKAIGWFIEEYGFAQISMNLTNIRVSPLHMAFAACEESAQNRGIRVTGSELIGLVPKSVLIDAGKYFLRKQKASSGLSERELIQVAVRSLGLEELGPFDVDNKVIEYAIAQPNDTKLVSMTLTKFADETASESPAPGGGSVSALIGSFGAALGAMVANLTGSKKGYEKSWEKYSEQAVKAQSIKQRLLGLVDEDTAAFNGIIEAIRLPKATEEEQNNRLLAIKLATKKAIEVPYQVMNTCAEAIPVLEDMVVNGNPNSVSDAGVGVLCLKAAITGAWYNVRINLKDFDDQTFSSEMTAKGKHLFDHSMSMIDKITLLVEKTI